MNNRKLRIAWVPNLGSGAFYIPVSTPEEAKKIMDVLAFYDCFLMNKGIRGDYCNIGVLQIWDENEQEWNDWHYEDDENYFDDLDEFIDNLSPIAEELEVDSSVMAVQVHFD